MSHRNELPVNETFHTFQGEGPRTGVPAHFVRLSGCNLHCRWCDTPFTWKKGEVEKPTWMTWEDILVPEPGDGHRNKRPGVLVITGGEPMLHYDKPAFMKLREHGVNWYTDGIEIETNGTILPESWEHGLRFNVSPKLPSAKAGIGSALRPVQYARWLAVGAIFKFVVSDIHDIHDVVMLSAMNNIPAGRIWIMPEGRTRAEALAWLDANLELIEFVRSRGWNLSLRVHTIIWNDKRER